MSKWSGPVLPMGTLTFLFTDVEGSTRLWEAHPQAMRSVMARHDALLTQVFEAHNGVVVRPRGEGDALFAVFVRASDAVTASLDGQRALAAEDWGETGSLRVRMGLHTGEADLREGDYYGSAVNRCARIRAAGHGGQVLISTATEHLVRGALPDAVALRHLGRHRLKDLAEPEDLYQLDAPGLRDQFPPLKTVEFRPTNLPPQLTQFVGRDADLAAISGLLRSQRLVTLTGPGGSGKTRLALELAASVTDAYADGTFVVDLAALSDPQRVPAAVARALGVLESDERTQLQGLTLALSGKRLLLILDNFEHLLPAAPFVAALLATCPELTVLVTSRTALRISAEQVYPLAPLPTPTSDAQPVTALVENPSVRLFAARARAAQPAFQLTDETAAAVAAICTRLDGLPLAIELAAARTNILPPHMLQQRLSAATMPLTLLTGGMRDRPQRHQSLRETMAWSYALLEPHEQAVFRRLTVFSGGCTLEAAAAVMDPETTADIVDLAGSLVEKNLLRMTPVTADGEPRLSQLETLRAFGREQLEAEGELLTALRGQAEWCVALVEEAEPNLLGPGQTAWLARLDAEVANLRTALTWLIAADEGELALRIVAASRWYWTISGYASEGREWALAALALPSASAPTYWRAKALLHAALATGNLTGDTTTEMRDQLAEAVAIARALGDQHLVIRAIVPFAQAQQDATEGRRLLDEGCALAGAIGDGWGLAYAHHYYAYLETRTGAYAAAQAHFEQSLALYRAAGDAHDVANCLQDLGGLALRLDDNETAQRYLEESLPLLRRGRFPVVLGITLSLLGRVAMRRRDEEGAEALFAESSAIFRRLGMARGLASTLQTQSIALMGRRHYRRAAELLVEAMAAWQVAGSIQGTYGVMQATAGLAQALGMSERAACLFAATLIDRRRGAVRTGGYEALLQRTLAAVRASLGDERFERAWAEGEALTRAEAMRLNDAILDAARHEGGSDPSAAVLPSAVTERSPERR